MSKEQMTRIQDANAFIKAVMRHIIECSLKKEVSLHGLILSFDNKYSKVAIADTHANSIYFYYMKRGVWVYMFTYEYPKDDNALYVIESISMTGAGNRLAIGITMADIQTHGICAILDIHPTFVIESSIIKPDKHDLYSFGKQVRFSNDGQLLLVSATEYTQEAGNQTGVVLVHAVTADGSYQLVTAIVPQQPEIFKFGLALDISEDKHIIAIAGLQMSSEVGRQWYLTQTLIKASSDFKDLAYDDTVLSTLCSDDRLYLLRIANETIRFVSLPITTQTQSYSLTTQNVDEIFREIEYVMGESIKASEPVATIEEAPVIPSVDTKVLPAKSTTLEKDRMILRHHLVIQNLLNNIAISIKEGRSVDFKIKSLEITEDRIKIMGLDYKY